MDSAIVYLPSQYAQPLSRETLIYENAEMALAQVARLERHLIGRDDKEFTHPPFGLADIVSPDPVIAMGMLPHRLLADFQKRSLLAGELRLDEAVHGSRDIEQLIWSCANTSRAVVLDDDAWREVQMLPVGERRRYPVPPLKLPPAGAKTKAWSLFVINHGGDDRPARELAARAAAEGFSVAGSGISPDPGHHRNPVTHPFCCPEAAIHIHLGHHSAAASRFRLIDSWHSGRLAVQWVEARPDAGYEAEILRVEDAVNGLVCHSAEAALAMCREMEQDPVLCRKFVSAGHRAVEPLARAWSAIAEDLLR